MARFAGTFALKTDPEGCDFVAGFRPSRPFLPEFLPGMMVEWSFAMLAQKWRRTDNKSPCSLPRLAISPTDYALRRYCGATSTATFN